jgi:maleate isomerase
MAYTSWRGICGLIKPTHRPGSLEELILMLPEGIGVIPTLLNITKGTKKEFSEAAIQYEAPIRELAEQGVDIIHPGGSPPWMLMGYKAEQQLVKNWEKKYKIQFFTPGMNHARAMKAMGCKRLVNIAYTTWDDSAIVAAYYKNYGIELVSREVFPVDFQKVQELAPTEVYAFIKRVFLKHHAQKKLDGIYIQGGAWRVLDIIEPLEQDLGIPVIHPSPAKAWEVMRRLHVRQPMGGYGRLLAEMPEG